MILDVSAYTVDAIVFAALKKADQQTRSTISPQTSPSSTLPQVLQKMVLNSPSNSPPKPNVVACTIVSQENNVISQEPPLLKHTIEESSKSLYKLCSDPCSECSSQMISNCAQHSIHTHKHVCADYNSGDSRDQEHDSVIPSLSERLTAGVRVKAVIADPPKPQLKQTSLDSMARIIRSCKGQKLHCDAESSLITHDQESSKQAILNHSNNTSEKPLTHTYPEQSEPEPSNDNKTLKQAVLPLHVSPSKRSARRNCLRCSPKKLALSSSNDETRHPNEQCIIISDSSSEDDLSAEELPLLERIQHSSDQHSPSLNAPQVIHVLGVGTRHDPVVVL